MFGPGTVPTAQSFPKAAEGIYDGTFRLYAQVMAMNHLRTQINRPACFLPKVRQRVCIHWAGGDNFAILM